MAQPPQFAGSVPESYDRYLGPVIFEPYAIDLVERSPVDSALHILEIACGTGRVTKHIARLAGENAKIAATDISPDMMSMPKLTVTDKRISWEVADAQALPFPDASFDLVLCQFGFMFVPDKEKAFSEVFRVLKPGGRFLFNTWDSLEKNPAFKIANSTLLEYFPGLEAPFYLVPFSMFDVDGIVAVLKKTGFSQVEGTLVQKECVAETSMHATKGLLDGTPVSGMIMQNAPEKKNAIAETVQSRLSAAFGEAPMVSTMQACVFEAAR